LLACKSQVKILTAGFVEKPAVFVAICGNLSSRNMGPAFWPIACVVEGLCVASSGVANSRLSNWFRVGLRWVVIRAEAWVMRAWGGLPKSGEGAISAISPAGK